MLLYPPFAEFQRLRREPRGTWLNPSPAFLHLGLPDFSKVKLFPQKVMITHYTYISDEMYIMKLSASKEITQYICFLSSLDVSKLSLSLGKLMFLYYRTRFTRYTPNFVDLQHTRVQIGISDSELCHSHGPNTCPRGHNKITTTDVGKWTQKL